MPNGWSGWPSARDRQHPRSTPRAVSSPVWRAPRAAAGSGLTAAGSGALIAVGGSSGAAACTRDRADARQSPGRDEPGCLFGRRRTVLRAAPRNADDPRGRKIPDGIVADEDADVLAWPAVRLPCAALAGCSRGGPFGFPVSPVPGPGTTDGEYWSSR